MTLAAGTRLGPYEIDSLIGAGGMGEVYKAHDTRLGRLVAIKVLPPAVVHSEEQRARFEREARTIAALNHPNICTLHDIGEHQGERFIVMELLDGCTLRELAAGKPPNLATTVGLSLEITDALATAHGAGIIHRDITPSNLFVTKAGGHAKILDFGLAKPSIDPAAAEVPASDASTIHAPVPAMVSSPGTVVGTVAYMSPEQVRAQDLDQRTDLFSFGAVLYEVVTGRRPFQGESRALVFDAILHASPVPPTQLNREIPPELERIIGKALEKDRDLRYQSASEMKADLERLRRDRLFAAPARWRVRGTWRWAVPAGLLLVIAGAAGVRYLTRQPAEAVPLVGELQLTSGAGVETDPAISPDGHTIAFTSNEAGNSDIWIVDAHGGPVQRLTTHPASDRSPSWFPDGSSLAFASDRSGRTDIWRAPRFSGDAATLLVPDADMPAVSPDGSQVTFVKAPSQGDSRIAVAPLADIQNIRILTTDGDGSFDHRNPSWSPDGRTLSYAAADGLWLVPAAGGRARRIVSDAQMDYASAWSADGRFVYFTSVQQGRSVLFRVPANGGPTRRVTVGSGSEHTPAVSRDGRLLAFSTSIGNRSLALFDLASRREETLDSGSRDELFPAFSPERSKVYFVSNRWGRYDIWSRDLPAKPDTGAQRLIEQGGTESHIDCSRDGQWLAYYCILGDRRDIWVVRTTGGLPVRITDDQAGALYPAWSPDGRRLVFTSRRDGTEQIWVQAISDGRPSGPAVRVTSDLNEHRWPVWSPDSSEIAYVTTAPGGQSEVALVRADGRQPPRIISMGAGAEGRIRWSRLSGLLFVPGQWGTNQFQLRSIDRHGRPQGPLLSPLPLGRDGSSVLLDVSADDRFVVTSKVSRQGEIWLLEARPGQF